MQEPTRRRILVRVADALPQIQTVGCAPNGDDSWTLELRDPVGQIELLVPVGKEWVERWLELCPRECDFRQCNLACPLKQVQKMFDFYRNAREPGTAIFQ